MAMMISKFHRLIQNKLTWWFIIGIIVITFVFWGSQAGIDNEKVRKASAMATLNGAPIDQTEFSMAYASTHLSFMLQSGRQIDETPQVSEMIRKQAWMRIAALREVAALGISVSDDELLPFMNQAYTVFRNQQGQFDPQAFAQFAQQFLPRFGFTAALFDQFIREEIAIQKAGTMVLRSMLVSPAEARRMYHSMNDTFVASYALLTPEDVEKNIKVGMAEARALFDKDPKAYTIPEKAVVSYVEITYSNFLAKAEVKDDEILSYYNSNLDDFIIPSTNAASTNDFSAETVKYKTQEDAKPEIVKALKELAAARLAASNAVAFVAKIQGTIDAKPMSFTEAAAAAGLKISESKPFAEDEDVPGLKVDPRFNRAAFALVPDEGGNVSDAIEGEHGIYVLAYNKRMEERVPNFDEVAEKALADARNLAIEDAITALAKKTRDAMDAAAKAGKSVTDAAKMLGVKLVTTAPFSATGDNDMMPNFNELIRTVLTHNAGEVSEAVPTRSGMLVAYVAQRIPADQTVFEQNRPGIAGQIRRAQGRQLFESWQAYLLKRDKFEDLLKKATTEEG